MTSTEIRESLTHVGAAVEVPVVDRVAFQARVRAERRRRTAGRSLVAAAAAVTVVGSALAVTSTGGGAGPDRDRFTDPAGAPNPAPATLSSGRVPLALEGRLQELLPDGGSYATDQRVEEVLGSGPDGVVVIDGDSRLQLLPVDADGRPGDARPLAGGDPVQRAWLDKTGEFLGYVDLGNRLHLRAVVSDRDTESVPLLDQQTRLMATDGTRWVEDEGDRLSLRLPDQSFEIDSNGDPLRAELAGDTLAVHTRTGIEFYDSADGTRRLGNLGGTTGSLSPDGTTYAAGRDDVERDQGMRPALFLVDTRTGDQTRGFTGYAADMTALALTWQDEDDFLVLASSSVRTGNHVLYACSVTSRACEERFDDPTGTLRIASQ
ncbi:hypothetical protein H5V45_15395 [Nocardioides sp. KIGAM211]|uniref:Uncharacterized protein n=1 Tax=Nocardioides luti TaxID=2761101 RepID=A0A7X0VBR9_9ACTN|nr:hypothetical protein [Nocardioides luti]MBB6628710.1 hypothetical protein [Nocardioides luti]